MKKNGFTLAEVLITLGIVGVIAAITLPTLMTDTTSAQIGPKLAKAVSMFEQANEAMLNDSSVDAISDMLTVTDDDVTQNYWVALSNHLKGTIYSGGYLVKDGTYYSTDSWAAPANPNVPPHRQRLGNFYVDINGDSNPNAESIDRFTFALYNDGSLRPYGATNWNNGQVFECDKDPESGKCKEDADGNEILLDSTVDSPNGSQHWTTQCPINAIPEDPLYCAGHIFENNLKVLYK